MVLSSNDGCVVARSNEAKALGIPMGAPAFKYRQLFKDHSVICRSANFELYGDISKRITMLLTSITPRIEVYSIDESFLDLSQLDIADYTEWARLVRQKIIDWVGIPVSIGIATTKTLAKLASERAKKDSKLNGILHLIPQKKSDHLQQIAIEDVWGVGRKLSPKLRAEGVATALDLANLSPQLSQQLLGIHGRQMVAELNSIRCHGLQPEDQLQKSISRTRTFGEDTTNANMIEAALANFVSQATFRLRREHQLAKRAGLFLTNSRHKPGYRVWSREAKFATPTADPGTIISVLVHQFADIYTPNILYHRAGIWLDDFVPEDLVQTDLIGAVNGADLDLSKSRMTAVDNINNRWGKRTLYYAAEDLGNRWQPQHNLRSPRYVSNWNELPKAKIMS